MNIKSGPPLSCTPSASLLMTVPSVSRLLLIMAPSLARNPSAPAAHDSPTQLVAAITAWQSQNAVAARRAHGGIRRRCGGHTARLHPSTGSGPVSAPVLPRRSEPARSTRVRALTHTAPPSSTSASRARLSTTCHAAQGIAVGDLVPVTARNARHRLG